MLLIQNSKFKIQNLGVEVGFTLVELSIVIVLIGLIVAGVVGGQQLVQQAKLRGLISDINKYEVAINSFRLEYDAYPGDFNRASAYGFGDSGNGDRQLTDNNPVPESLWFVVHMNNAGLIEGSYSHPGVINPHQIGYNKPWIGYRNNVSFYVHYAGVTKASTANHSGTASGLYQDYFGNAMEVGSSDNSTGTGRIWNGFLSPKDAQSIDSKIDDGEPGIGKLVVTGTHNTATCTDKLITQTLPVAFNFSDTTDRCRLFYKLQTIQ